MAEDLRGSEESLGTFTGLLYTAPSCGMLLSAVVWARASNTYGRRWCLLLGLSSNVAMTMAIALCTDYWAIVGLRLLSGLLNNNLSAVRTTLRERFAVAGGEEERRAFSLLTVSFGVSSVAGPSLGGMLYGQSPAGAGLLQPWSPPMLTCTGFYFACLVVVALLLPETADFQELRKPPSGGGLAAAGEGGQEVPLLRRGRFLLLLAMGGGHSYVLLGWELVYPLLARLRRSAGGEGWGTPEIGCTFLIGSAGLVLYSLLVFPRLAARTSVSRLWMYHWALPLLAMPVFPRALEWMVRAGVSSASMPVRLWNYAMQLLVSVLLGSQFISLQLLLNSYVAEQPDSQRLLAVANSYMVSMQALVRATSPLVTGSLFTLGIHGDWKDIFGAALPIDHLALVGLASGILCALAFERREA
mmetsp:Transcript_65206/g.204335  ORF Transcript_65206/g.204335 Transcript_65206/m.204335 type:complete len:414 (+) Transcript_65206:152-1393(+)